MTWQVRRGGCCVPLPLLGISPKSHPRVTFFLYVSAARFAVPSSRALIPPGRAGTAGCAATARLQRAPARRSLAVQAARSGGKKGRAAGEAPQPKEQRTLVTFRAPGQAPRRFQRVTQAELNDYLQLKGAELSYCQRQCQPPSGGPARGQRRGPGAARGASHCEAGAPLACWPACGSKSRPA